MPPSSVGAIRHSSVFMTSGNLEVDAGKVGHGPVGQLLHPRRQGVRSLELAGGIAVQDLLGLRDGGAGPDLPGHLFLRGNDPLELLTPQA